MRANALCYRGALLGTTVTMLLACGGSERGPTDDVEAREARITALGPAIVQDCSVGLAFDISAPAAIGLVGVAPLGNIAQPPALALYSVDAWGREQLVATEATSVNAVTLALVAQANSAQTIALGDDSSTFHGTEQHAAVNVADSLWNGTSFTSSESGSYARDSYGDQALLQESLAAAGWSPEPVSYATAFLSSTTEQSEMAAISHAGRVTEGHTGTLDSLSAGNSAISGFDATGVETNAWANRLVDTGIGRLNVRESWGKDQAFGSQQGVDAIGGWQSQTGSAQASTVNVASETNAIQSAWAIHALDSLDSRHFVLRVQAVASGGPAGIRVFQGTESALYAASDVSVALPACGQ